MPMELVVKEVLTSLIVGLTFVGLAFSPPARALGNRIMHGRMPTPGGGGEDLPGGVHIIAAGLTKSYGQSCQGSPQKSSGRIGTRLPAGRAGAFGGRTSRQSASARGESSELSCERTGMTIAVPSSPRMEVARM